MRTTAVLSALLLSACDHSEPEDTAPDSDVDSDAAVDTTPCVVDTTLADFAQDTAEGLVRFIREEGCLEPEVSVEGFLEIGYRNPAGEYYCVNRQDVLSSSVFTPCPDCDFAFEMTLDAPTTYGPYPDLCTGDFVDGPFTVAWDGGDSADGYSMYYWRYTSNWVALSDYGEQTSVVEDNGAFVWDFWQDY